jgi:hypothetical protein
MCRSNSIEQHHDTRATLTSVIQLGDDNTCSSCTADRRNTAPHRSEDGKAVCFGNNLRRDLAKDFALFFAFAVADGSRLVAEVI